MEIQTGDNVRVTDPESNLYEEVGEVIGLFRNGASVSFGQMGANASYDLSRDKLEVVSS